MSSNKSLFQKPVFWVAVAGLGIAAFVMTEPDAAPKSVNAKKSTKKKPTSKKSEVVFTEEDEKATFAPVNSEGKNTFVPIVARHSGIGSADGQANAIPTDMTGGEGNWVYTGTAESDGARVALIENRTTGDAVFLRRGERWKSAFVVSVSEYSIILRGPGGTRTLGLVDESLKVAGSSVASAGPQGFSPAQVNVPDAMRGPIGRRNRGNDTFSMTPDGSFGQGALPSFPGNEPE